MSEKRVNFYQILQNQLPSYVTEEFPLVSEFLSQYYISQEYQGAPIDLIQNIDKYIKVDEQTNLIDSVKLASDISFLDDEILVNLAISPSGTNGFPEKYGLLQIDDEIITYTGKTFNSFTGCIRGFSGISSYKSQSNPEELVFSATEVSEHSTGSSIINLSSLFLREFLLKTKYQLTPGFENRKITETINESIFIKQIRDFYNSKGTDKSFELLFSILYGERVSVIKPRDYLFRPSDAHYQITRDFVVESIEGNPEELENSVLIQDEILNYTKAYAPITKVEKFVSSDGKIYYKLSIDANYDRDLNVDGSIYGEFKIHPQTRVIGDYNSNSNTITVDSTVGFPENGDLRVIYQDGTEGIIQYQSKNINQFFECSNITGSIDDASEINLDVFAYGESYINNGAIIKVRITSVLNDLELIDDTYYLKSGYNLSLKTLGVNATDVKANNWFFNISPIYEVESLEVVDESDQSYRINLFNHHILKNGDKIKIINRSGEEKNSIVIDIVSDLSFIIIDQGELDVNEIYKVQRNILNPYSSKYSDIISVNANIQNVYTNKNDILVASSSLPYYPYQDILPSNKEVIFSGTFDSDIFKITGDADHGFYTGDIVYYSPEKIINKIINEDGSITENTEILSSIFDEGIYFIKRIDSNSIKLALSYSDIFNSNFISVDNEVTVKDNKFQYIRFYDKSLKSQNLLREIKNPMNDGGVYPTLPGFTGIFINGVELLNYKSKDTVYSGSLTGIDVISPGFGYDVINSPSFIINDSLGIGASAFCAVKGSLTEIRIIDSGFDYDGIPTVKITGGNGTGAKAYASMKLIDHQSFFNSDVKSNRVSLSSNSIGFSTYHKFRNAEKIIYNTNNQTAVGGISTNSIYYVSVKSPTEIKLHKTSNDAVIGINTISLTSYGIGKHSLKSYNKKLVLGSINIENSGSGYENKKRTVLSTTEGILTSINEINIPNHDFKTGEVIKYSTTGTEIQGLVSGNEYYITKVDENKFKLSEIGTDNIESDFYFNTKQYINFQSIGSGIHSFNYPEIKVEVVGNVGGLIKFNAVIDPIFRGEISSVHLESGGIGYGASEILNYNRQPLMRLKSGSGAQVTPIISDGKIVEVLINSNGSGYESSPDIIINGDGIGAVLVPILEDERLVEIRVLESGIGYSKSNTSIDIVPSGSSSEFFAKIQTWNVNLFQKNLNSINDDDGILETGINDEYELQYSHLYAPRKLRELIYSKDQDGNVLYGRRDLRKISNKEINSTDHSPIIGWSYDGNPIYGPYGYITKQGGIISQMKSGYIIDIKENRPSLSSYPEGFFIEDYSHFESSDDTVLDEFNGRYCVTPEYPNGTYAYFATIDNSLPDSDGKFSGYKRPSFPYIIGNKFKSKPNDFNFIGLSNQNEIDINQTDWIRNINPYNLIEKNSYYPYLEIPNNLDQDLTIKYALPGKIEKIDILSGGSNYKVGDRLIFDNDGTNGYNASAEVERIEGEVINSIGVETKQIYNVEFVSNINNNGITAFSDNPHDLNDSNICFISGFNTTSSLLEGTYRIKVNKNNLSLGSSVGNISATGIVTYFNVSGNLYYPNIRENDILKIGEENIKVLNIDLKSSRIRVLRSINGTVGSSHSLSDKLYEIPRKLEISVNFRDSYTKKHNKEIYFNPSESIGLGTQYGVGIGTTISFSNPGAGITQIFIPTKTIYIPNHKLETGDEVVYYTNSGSPIGVSTDGISTSIINNNTRLHIAKISNDLIGLSTVKIGLNNQGNFAGITSSTQNIGTLFFTGVGTGVYHSFKTQYETLIGNINRNIVTVETKENHNLINGDKVFIDVNPSISTSIYITYNDKNQKLTVNPRSFESIGVNTLTDTITIQNHGFIGGQKIIHTSTNPSVGLENDKEYYVYFVDNNNIKLTNTHYDSLIARPKFVGISSASGGILSPINPPIELYKNSSVYFDLSDSSLSYIQQSTSYSAFDLRFFRDSNFTDPYESNDDESTFSIQKNGRVGISSNANVILTINEKTPENLYYTLVPVYFGNIPESKEKIKVDSEVTSNNEIRINESKYNGVHFITVESEKSFKYDNISIPENDFYDSGSSTLRYETDSKNVEGEISKLKITGKGQNYYSLPSIHSVKTINGKGALFDISSKSIGRLKSTRINDIGFNFPSDFSLRPIASIPQVIQINSLSSFDSIEAISFGRGYTSSPKLIVLDGRTNDLITDVDLKFNIKDKNVEILENTFSLSNVIPNIIPIQNSNGVGISSINYNSITKKVTVVLSVGFSTENSFPFDVDDKVLIENISIGIGSEGRGFNSEDYGYKLFTVTSIDPNIGGENGTVTYSLSDVIGNNETTGLFDPTNSSGRIIPEKYFPKFDIKIRENNFFIGEDVYTDSISGKVEDWDSKINSLKVVSREDFNIGDIIVGDSSKTKGIISSIKKFGGFINLKSNSRYENGWISSAGVLNDTIQRIQDSFYYQNFSYSLKSRVDYDTWNDPVSTLNHTLGFRKFSDYQLESQNSNLSIVGLSTDLTSFEVITDIVSVIDLNCVYDFDLVKENSLQIGNSVFSDEIMFSNRILTDYSESIGNRVLSIDDISPQFNSVPRPTKFSEISRFNINDVRFQKCIIYIRDMRFLDEKEFLITTSLIDDFGKSYINQYGIVDSVYDMGYFDVIIDGEEGVLLYYPTKFAVNDFDITTLCYNINDNLTGVANTIFANVIKIESTSTLVSYGSTTIISVPDTYRAFKALVTISADNNRYEFNELTVVQDGSDIILFEYGQLSNYSNESHSSIGLGTYYGYYDGSDIKIDFIPNDSFVGTVNSIKIIFSLDSTNEGVGFYDMKHARLYGKSSNILSSPTPSSSIISSYPVVYDGGYCIVQVSDNDNNIHQISEFVVLSTKTNVLLTEYGNVYNSSGLGTIGSYKDSENVYLTFTPNPDINVNVKVYMNILRYEDDDKDIISFSNSEIQTDYGIYEGTEKDVKRSFYLTHKNYPIFERYFNANDTEVVNVENDLIKIPNHFFSSGELIRYINPGTGTTQSIEIEPTNFIGIGITDRLPENIYAIKIDSDTIRLSKTAEDSLKNDPIYIDIVNPGIGSFHKFVSTNQNSKSIIAIDNLIQSPVVSTSVTTTLSDRLFTTDNVIYFSDVNSFFGGDLIQINDEIMKVETVGIGSTNAIRVRRPWIGTVVSGYSTGNLVTKISGNYNIIDNVINFVEPPYGNILISTSTNPPNERDWTNLADSSEFQGRVFLRSGIKNSNNETYYKNCIFDDFSTKFNGSDKVFTLTKNGSNITGISNENAIILINGIFQGPGIIYDYNLSENIGITSISFTGSATSVSYDVNNASVPRGGIIVSIGSTEGFGYQPLVCAGGTAVVSISGTISSISIGNSGSGYRSGSQIVRVGVANSSLGDISVEFIGNAVINNGNIVSVAITNPGSGYTSTNPPYVIFDEPLSYNNIPLIYSSSSGIGTEARVNIVVGQESNVINFEIINNGYGYDSGDILTIPIGGSTGIPTTGSSQFNEFQILVDKVFYDKFSGWSIGELQVLDNLDAKFNGRISSFPITISNNPISIRSSKGSNINIQDTLLVFINDVLQVPGKGYVFNGGSIIRFTEPPKIGDKSKILFYRGSGSVDVVDIDIIETVKVGDELTIDYDSSVGQSPTLQEEARYVTSINSTDLVSTNPYFGPGNISDELLERPVKWCRQSEDRIIDDIEVGKDRMLYEPIINPTSYVTKSVGIGSTIVYVDNIRPFFNQINENDTSLNFQNYVTLISQENKVGCSATAIVSIGGSISSVQINDGGNGYLNSPVVIIQDSVGIGTTLAINATAFSSITSGIVTSIIIINSGSGYDPSNPPIVIVEKPTFNIETNSVNKYEGDSGVIVGIFTGSVGGASTAIIFDLHIPQNSFLRNSSITGLTTISGIKTGDYFVVYNSNIGNPTISLDSNNSVIGIGSTFIDNVYRVSSVSIAQTSVIGIGTTTIVKVVTSVMSNSGLNSSNTNKLFGEYSWGKVTLDFRAKENEYESYTMNGVTGLSTGTILKRTKSLKYSDYIP